MVRLDARLLGRVDAEDVLQESYLEAVKRAHHYREGTSSQFVWVRLVVLQTLADVARRHLGAGRRSVAREVSLPDANGTTRCGLAQPLVRTGTSPTGAAVRAEDAERLHAVIGGLSPTDQEILTLRHFEELSNGEVAEVLGLHKAAATNRYLRALQRLRVALGEDGGSARDH